MCFSTEALNKALRGTLHAMQRGHSIRGQRVGLAAGFFLSLVRQHHDSLLMLPPVIDASYTASARRSSIEIVVSQDA